MNKRALLLLPVAAALLATGCGSTAAPEAAGATAGQLDARALSDIAGQVAKNHEQAVVIDKETIKGQLPLAEKARKAMKVSPQQCTQFVGGDVARELDKMNVISVSLPGATPLEGVQVGLASYGQRADAAANMAQAEGILKDCSKFSFSLQGQETQMAVARLSATTTGEKTSAIRTTTSAGDTTISTVSVNALDGQNVVTVAFMGGADTAKDLARAQELADTVLGLARKNAS